jgi:hypothetical protein
MLQLFERMTHIYGHKWTSIMGTAAVNENGDLTDAAKTWQHGLIGITPQQIGNGLKRCLLDNEEWSPSLPKFRAMCIHRDDVPSIPQIVQILLRSLRIDENVAKTYQHPIAYEIARHGQFDATAFRFSNNKQCEDMIKPLYEHFLAVGFEDFKPEHYENHKRLSAPEYKPNKELARKMFAELHNIIGE